MTGLTQGGKGPATRHDMTGLTQGGKGLATRHDMTGLTQALGRVLAVLATTHCFGTECKPATFPNAANLVPSEVSQYRASACSKQQQQQQVRTRY